MQALFLRFFEKKLFLIHYEQEKISKKFRFFCLFRASSTFSRLKSWCFDTKDAHGNSPGTAKADIRSVRHPLPNDPSGLGPSSFRLVLQIWIFSSFRLKSSSDSDRDGDHPSDCSNPAHSPSAGPKGKGWPGPAPPDAAPAKFQSNRIEFSPNSIQTRIRVPCRIPGSCRA